MDSTFGDVVIYKGHMLEDKILNLFIGEWTHAALRTYKGTAISHNIWGKTKHNLNIPKKDYNEYLILRHKEITPYKQNRLKRLNRYCNSDYDLQLIFQIATKKIFKEEPDRKNMYHKGKSTCTSRIAHMYRLAGLHINEDIHFSQIEPFHFLDSKYFDVIYEWQRKQ